MLEVDSNRTEDAMRDKNTVLELEGGHHPVRNLV